MALYQILADFKRPSSEKELTESFSRLAPHFIYGGYINVRDVYRVYICTVEFYFHDEKERANPIKDFIVYHRNRPEKGIVVPYFPLMTLHAHVSGFDITFENEEQGYRASALIREYSVFDVNNNRFLELKKNNRDDRSTYLYDYLNGFSLAGDSGVRWVDEERFPRKSLLQGRRCRVCAYWETGNPQEPYKKIDGVPDDRPWSFKLNDDLCLPTD